MAGGLDWTDTKNMQNEIAHVFYEARRRRRPRACAKAGHAIGPLPPPPPPGPPTLSPFSLACDPPPTRTPSVGEGWKRAQQIEVWPPPRRQIYKSQEAISKSRLMQNGNSTSGCSVCTICDRIVGDRMNDQDSNHLTTTGCTVSREGRRVRVRRVRRQQHESVKLDQNPPPPRRTTTRRQGNRREHWQGA